ncbi:hypothetical protein [Asticcacaulis taihuensis]|uniref:hypothetical protein n=1 Tax=Asticcacaulis taihuensis TaxID=260084 RepID=UPI003F7BAE76
MNSTGLLFLDVPVMLFFAYVFGGGLLVTLAGLAISIAVSVSRKSWKLMIWALVSLSAPFAYIVFWSSLRAGNLPSPPSTDFAVLAALAGGVLCVFSGPVIALLTAIHSPKSVKAVA